MKYVIIIPLMLLLAALATFVPLRPGLKELAREMMRERITEEGIADEATELIAAADIPQDAWEGDDEFRLNGHLFDVASVVYINGQKAFHCFSDDAELNAEVAADELVASLASPAPATPRGRLAKELADWLQHLFYEPAAAGILVHHAICKRAFGADGAVAMHAAFLARVGKPPEA